MPIGTDVPQTHYQYRRINMEVNTHVYNRELSAARLDEPARRARRGEVRKLYEMGR